MDFHIRGAGVCGPIANYTGRAVDKSNFPNYGRKPKFDEDIQEMIIAEYEAGGTLKQIAAKYECAPKTVRNIVDRG